MNLTVENVKKTFGDKVALDVERYAIHSGEIIGLVGNNGAGKTTLFRIILDLLHADSGSVTVDGEVDGQLLSFNTAGCEDWKKYVGAYAAAMGGIDVLVFTAGVGENQTPMREDVCRGLEFMGIKIDAEKNAKIRGEEAIISTPDSRVKVVVIPTDEELMIASDTMALISK